MIQPQLQMIQQQPTYNAYNATDKNSMKLYKINQIYSANIDPKYKIENIKNIVCPITTQKVSKHIGKNIKNVVKNLGFLN